MQTIKHTISINAPRQKVWNIMLEDKTYRIWTHEFNPGSYYEGSWEKGKEIRFLGQNEKGLTDGMYSRIKESIPNQFISIEHLGIITDGVVDTTSDKVKKWAPSFENYTFKDVGASTQVEVEMQVDEEYKSVFDEMWPKALKVLKKLCEN